jgi:hypothetical protein
MERLKKYRVSLSLILVGLAITVFVGLVLVVSPATLIGPTN